MRSEWWEYEPCAAKLSIARVLVDDQPGEDAAAPSEVILAAWNAHRLGAIETLTNVARCPCAWEWAGSLRSI